MATSRSCDWVVATAASAWSIAARSTPCAAAAASSPGRATGAITAACAAVTVPSPNAAATAGRCSSARPVATSFVAAPPDSRACPHSHDVMLFLPSDSAASASSPCRTVRATSAASRFWACSRSPSLSSSCGPNIAGRSSAARASRVEPSSPMTPPAPRPYLCPAYLLECSSLRAMPAPARPVGGVDYPRTYQEFKAWFPDDVACREYLGKLRWPDGFICPECGCGGGWRTGKGLWMCAECGKKTSVTAGTIFHRSHTPLSTWFAAVWFVTSQKNGVSAQGLKDALGFGSYETAWAWLHKLRRAMVRPDRE